MVFSRSKKSNIFHDYHDCAYVPSNLSCFPHCILHKMSHSFHFFHFPKKTCISRHTTPNGAEISTPATEIPDFGEFLLGIYFPAPPRPPVPKETKGKENFDRSAKAGDGSWAQKWPKSRRSPVSASRDAEPPSASFWAVGGNRWTETRAKLYR